MQEIIELFQPGVRLTALEASARLKRGFSGTAQALARMAEGGQLARAQSDEKNHRGQRPMVYWRPEDAAPPPGPRGDWTDERIASITKLWNEGQSALQIAVALGLGPAARNKIVGKLARLGLTRTPPGTPKRKATVRVTEPRAALRVVSIDGSPPPSPRPARVQARPDAFLPLPGDTHKPWTERKALECKWPLDVGDETHSCCRPVSRSGYCAKHVTMAFQAPATAAQSKARADFRAARRYA